MEALPQILKNNLEYKRIAQVKVSPLETAVAADAASSPSWALPAHALAAPVLAGNSYTRRKLLVFEAWPPV